MYAAATETGLNTDASASIAIDRDQNAGPDTGELKPHHIRVAPVSEESVPAKLEAVAARRPEPLRRVVLHHEQAKHYVSTGRPEVLGAENLKQVFDYLTGDARIERVLNEYCQQRVKEWEAARRDENDPDRLVHYVPAHYSLLKEGFQPSDASSRFGSGGNPQSGAREESEQDPYKPVAASWDDEETELTKLLETSRLLCISEDAGAGKSIFTRRLLAFLSSPAGQATLFDSKPCLAVRWEEWTDEWPADFWLRWRRRWLRWRKTCPRSSIPQTSPTGRSATGVL